MKVKLRRPERSEEDKKAIVKDYRSGKKIADIMTKYKISKGGIYYIIGKFNENG